jgi:dihydroorotase
VNLLPYLLKGGLVVDPQAETAEQLDLLIDSGRVTAAAAGITAPEARIITVDGCYVLPGLLDLHCHLREPGEEFKETIRTGTLAAARGGFTGVVAMGNTNPPADSRPVIEFIKRQAGAGSVPVYPVGCATKGRRGEEPSEIGDLYEAGVVALSDDGSSIMNSEVLRRVMEYSRMFGLVIISHCEDQHLSAGGLMHEGFYSTVYGLRGIPGAAEEVHVARDLILAEMTGARLHIAHVSSAGSVRLIREAKQRGVRVTAEVTPHHLCLTDEVVYSHAGKFFDTNTKVNPPLRSGRDAEALLAGLRDGAIDCIATDHAPHTREEKEVEYSLAASGISGLETAVPLVWDRLVQGGVLSPAQFAQKMALNPARIIGLPERRIMVGEEANLTVIDPRQRRRVDVMEFASLGKNTPFDGWELCGWPVLTVAAGKIAAGKLGEAL